MTSENDDYDYVNETVIGHTVKAKVEEVSRLRQMLDDYDDADIPKRSPMVEIEVGDVHSRLRRLFHRSDQS